MKLAHRSAVYNSSKIDLLPGVWADGENLEECRKQLREVLEEWLLLSLRMGHHIPVIDKIDIDEHQIELYLTRDSCNLESPLQ